MFLFLKLYGDKQIIFRIERFEKKQRIVLVDFLDSEQFSFFTSLINRVLKKDGPSLLLFRNYSGVVLREGSYVYILRTQLEKLILEERFTYVEDSAIILAEVDIASGEYDQLFSLVRDRKMRAYISETLSSDEQVDYKSLKISTKGSDKLVVKNIGQGSWNEIKSGTNTKIVFDFGTHYNTRIPDLKRLLGGTEPEYQQSSPSLLISHWDVDHYHFLKIIDDATIKSFSSIVFRNRMFSKLSKDVKMRLQSLNSNFYPINPQPKGKRDHPPALHELYKNGSLVIFNSAESSSANMNSLSLLVKKAQVSVLLTADQHYSQFDYYVLKQYLTYGHNHFLVVPHHGGYAGTYRYNTDASVRLKTAVISVGANTYGHPNPSNVRKLTAAGFTVVDFRTHTKDYHISL